MALLSFGITWLLVFACCLFAFRQKNKDATTASGKNAKIA